MLSSHTNAHMWTHMKSHINILYPCVQVLLLQIYICVYVFMPLEDTSKPQRSFLKSQPSCSLKQALSLALSLVSEPQGSPCFQGWRYECLPAFSHVGSEARTQVLKLARRVLYHPSTLSSSSFPTCTCMTWDCFFLMCQRYIQNVCCTFHLFQ